MTYNIWSINNNNSMLSVILLSYYSSDRIVKVHSELSKLLGLNNIPFELIIIDDGSGDNSYEIALNLEKENSNVRVFQLSKNYTSFYAIYAGLSVCMGDCAIPVPDDEQLPYQTLVEMYRLWQEGKKIIIPHRANRKDGVFNNLFANSYYRIINVLSDVKFPTGGTDTFFIDREVIDIINTKIHPVNTSIMAEVIRLGFNPVFYPYERGHGINTKTRWTKRKRIKLIKDTLFSNSAFPIRLITRTGLCFTVISFAIIVYYCFNIISDKSIWFDRLPQWTATTVVISFFSGLILFSLGIIAEYIWRIYEEVKNRPGFIIKKKDSED